LKSLNKFYGERVFDDPAKTALYSEERAKTKLICQNMAGTLSTANTLEWVRRSAASGRPISGNCGTQALVAYQWLIDNGVALDAALRRPVQVLRIEMPSPADHAFVVVNHEQGLPATVDSFKPGAMVLDPWAKIVCPAQAFARVWLTKMAKWSARGLRVGAGKEALDPMHPGVAQILFTGTMWIAQARLGAVPQR
jgi:hypothetical protein